MKSHSQRERRGAVYGLERSSRIAVVSLSAGMHVADRGRDLGLPLRCLGAHGRVAKHDTCSQLSTPYLPSPIPARSPMRAYGALVNQMRPRRLQRVAGAFPRR
jgi:hypothetical protein